MRIIRVIVLASAFASLASCSEDRQLFDPQAVNVLVVDTQLIVGDYFPRIVLSRTADPQTPFSLDEFGEEGAMITIFEAGGGFLEYRRSTQRGIYIPTAQAPFDLGRPNARVLPATEYRLEVVAQSGEVLTAVTTTPPDLDVDEWVLLDATGQSVIRQLRTFEELGNGVYDAPENQLVYSQGLLEATFSQRPDVPGFQPGVFSLDPGSDFVIDADFLEPEDLAEFNRNVNGPVVEVLDGRVRLPWLAIVFEGRYKIKVFAIDRNWFDLALSIPDLGQGGISVGENAGDGFERPNFRIEGGIGLFGSAAVDSIGFRVHPRP